MHWFRTVKHGKTIKICGAALIVTILTIGVFFAIQYGDQAQNRVVTAQVEEPTNVIHADELLDTKPENEVPVRKSYDAWTVIDPDTVSDDELPENYSSLGALVRPNDKFGYWLLNTPVEIPIPQIDKVFLGAVDRIESDGLGNTTIHARPQSEEDEFERLILSYDETNVLGMVVTTQGSWELVGTHSIGFLVSRQELNLPETQSEPDLGMVYRDRYANATYLPRRSEKSESSGSVD